MSGLPLLPTIIVDIAGSAANIIFAFLAMRYAFLLTRKQPDNFLWGYLFYVCLAIAAFSISRAVGHIAKQLFFIFDAKEYWRIVSPYSGGFNTLFMISVSAVMIFYHKGVQAYEAIEHKAGKLKNANLRLFNAAKKLKELNLNLEEKVEERTAELSKSEKKFRHLFSASKDMVYFCDTEQNLVDINQSGKQMLGYDVNDAPPLNLVEFFHNKGDMVTFFEMIEKDGYIQEMEAEFERKDGSVIYVLISATGLYNEQGKLTGCEGIAKDITRVKSMMEQLVSSEKMASVGQMAAGIAHEINTPLGVILGYSQLMMDDFEEDSETYENLQVIERQTKASRKIVADLLKFSRQSGSVRENISINEVLKDVAAVTEHNLNMDHIQIHLSLTDDLPVVVGDAEKLRQVIVNLINNAHHAMEDMGSGDLYINSDYDRQAGQVLAMIRDTGSGIPDKVKAKIFDPFFTTKPVGKGTGLGLSVSYGIIQDHGGMIEIESPVQDDRTGETVQGTKFRILLPIATEQDPISFQD